MINLNQLRIFYHTAKYQSCSQAAKDLCITQPAVTNQIRALENFYDLKLFKKKGRRIYLTDAGKTIYEYTRKIFAWEKELEDVMRDMGELKLGNLRVGTSTTYVRSLMPLLISSFSYVHPNIKIHLEEGNAMDMIRSLRNLKTEVAVVGKLPENPDIGFIPFCMEEVILIMAPNHHLAKKKVLSFDEIMREPIIMRNNGSATRNLINELFSLHQCEPNILMETGNVEFIKQLVQRGESIGFISREAASLELRQKKLVTASLNNQKMFLDINVAYLKNETLSAPAKVFIGHIKELQSPGDAPFYGLEAIKSALHNR